MKNLIILLSIFFKLCNCEKTYCDISYCNNRGVCTIENDKKFCICEENYYYGEKCEKVKDLCAPTTQCGDGSICSFKPGFFFCKCPDGKYGRICVLETYGPKNVIVIYPPVVKFGSKFKLLIMFEDMVKEKTTDYATIQLSTEHDILSLRYSNQFHESSDLEKVLNDNHFKVPFELPYNKGFYKIEEADLWEAGSFHLNFDICMGKGNCDTSISYITVYNPEATCITKFSSELGHNIYLPDTVEVDAYTIIRPKRNFDCGRENANFTFSYYLTHFGVDEILHKFDDQHEPFLKIPPYFFSKFKDRFVTVVSYIKEIVGDKVLEFKTKVSFF